MGISFVESSPLHSEGSGDSIRNAASAAALGMRTAIPGLGKESPVVKTLQARTDLRQHDDIGNG
jgi:hypothetical protein